MILCILNAKSILMSYINYYDNNKSFDNLVSLSLTLFLIRVFVFCLFFNLILQFFKFTSFSNGTSN